MVQRLLQVRAHLILCFRAEEKIEMVKDATGKTEVRKKITATGIDGWVPITEKNLPYELTCSLLLLPARPGVPLPIKCQEQHRALFPLDQPITEESGRQLAAWAAGGAAVTPAVIIDEQVELLTKIREAGEMVGLTPADKRLLWLRHVGAPKPGNAPLEALRALLAAINQRADATKGAGG